MFSNKLGKSSRLNEFKENFDCLELIFLGTLNKKEK